MSDPSDFVAQRTFLAPDDIRFKKEKARRAAPRVRLPQIPDGPCCDRCANWLRPEDADDFGECRLLVVVSEKATMGPERGTVFGIEQAMKQGEWGWEYLTTRGFFEGCSRYEAIEKERAA